MGLFSIVQNVIELSCTRSLGRSMPPSSFCEGLGGPLGIFGPSLDNCPEYLIAAGGGPCASLLDGNKMTTYVCNT